MRVCNRPILALAAASLLSACGADDAMLIAEILRGQQPPGNSPPPTGESEPAPPASGPPLEPPPPIEISEEQRAVQAILDANCTACHNPDAGLGALFSMDIDYLIDRGQIIPGDSNASLVYVRMERQEMPPPAILDQRPSAREIRRVGRFIDEEL